MAFEYMIQGQGPQVDVSLFGDAASQGINAGNASPTPVTSAIRGAIKGVQEGQEFALNQAKIEQIPAENELRRQQLETAQTTNQIRKLELEIATANKDLNTKIAAQELEKKKLLLEQDLGDLNNRKTIEERITSTDVATRRSVLQDPSLSATMRRDNKYFEGVLGKLSGDMTEEEKNNALAQLDFVKERELAAKKDEIASKFDESMLKEADKIYDSVSQDGQLAQLIGDMTPEEVSKRVQVFRKGTKQVRPDGTLNPDVKDTEVDITTPNEYQAFIDGKLVQGYPLNEDSANKVNRLKGLSKRQFSLLEKSIGITRKQEDAPAPVEQTAAKTETPKTLPVRGLAELSKQTSTSLQGALSPEDVQQVVQPGFQRGLALDAIQAAVPQFLQYNPITNQPNADTQAVINDASSKLAAKTMQELNEAAPETRESIRKWAEDNGVRLTFDSLKNYYGNTVQEKLGQAYFDAQAAGREARTDQETRAQSLAGKSPLEILQLGKQASTRAQDLGLSAPAGSPVAAPSGPTIPQVVEQTASSLSLTPAQTKDVTTKVTRVQSHPLLKDTPPEVKALAAVESGGRGGTSPTGVKGLLQVTKATAAGYGLDRDKPSENVLAGQMYIQDLIRDFGGNKQLAYAAYNAGPKVVKRAVKLAGAEDWPTVKKFLFRAMQELRSQLDYVPEKKIAETLPYPDWVSTYEGIFSGLGNG